MRTGIDPGHGGRDPGAVSPKRPALGDKIYTEEDDIALSIAKRVQGVLLPIGHAVVMTREDSRYLSLSQRTKMLNDAKCDIAVSIHLNSVTDHKPNYISTFIQGKGGQAEQLAKQLQPRLVQVTGWPDGGIRVKNLHITRETNMPAVLLELGFLSNPSQEQQLNDLIFQGRLAAAIVEGILAYEGKPVQPWQKSLIAYAMDPEAGQAEIKRAQQVWQKKSKAGDKSGIEAAHIWAQKVRQAMGLI